MSMLILAYYAYVKPFQSLSVNLLEISNEIFVMVVAHLLLFLTDFTPNLDFQYSVGWFLVGISISNLFVNMSYISLMSLIRICKKFKTIVSNLKRKL